MELQKRLRSVLLAEVVQEELPDRVVLELQEGIRLSGLMLQPMAEVLEKVELVEIQQVAVEVVGVRHRLEEVDLEEQAAQEADLAEVQALQSDLAARMQLLLAEPAGVAIADQVEMQCMVEEAGPEDIKVVEQELKEVRRFLVAGQVLALLE